jgi:dTDP-4-dehydrorhamnose 3,5-epimerase
MTISNTPLDGLLIIEPNVFEDERGYFFESFRLSALRKFGVSLNFVQENESSSNSNVIRGLHMQSPPYGQAKLVRVVRGAIYDVAVDVRKMSPTYGQYFGIELNEKNKTSFFIPEGFAHGFSCLANNTIVQYKCSNYYNKESECGLIWNDPALKIDWKVSNPIISDKDEILPPFNDFTSPY